MKIHMHHIGIGRNQKSNTSNPSNSSDMVSERNEMKPRVRKEYRIQYIEMNLLTIHPHFQKHVPTNVGIFVIKMY